MNFNDNFLYSSVFINTLEHLGLKNAVISPGSRNTPLIAALDSNTNIIKTVILDERSAAFFALGVAKATDNPVLLVTTSGTAVTELYPAIVEAFQSRIPLIVCTADRPPYLLNCGENQTINQDNIFSNHIRAYFYFNNLQPNIDSLNNLILNTTESFHIAKYKNKGPVHINFPFDKPLEPNSFNINLHPDIYNSLQNTINNVKLLNIHPNDCKKLETINLIDKLKNYKKGLFIIGGGNYSAIFYSSIYELANKLGFLIYADILSSFNFNHSDNNDIIINNLHFLLENDSFQKLISPEIIVQFGKTPINKKILDFFKNSKSVKVLVNEYGELFDPSKTVNEIYSISENSVANFANDVLKSIEQRTISGEYKVVVGLNKKVESIKLTELNEYPFMFEGNIFSFVSEVINIDIPIVVSNSMPVRYFDLFSLQKKSNNKIYCNRGASGIDGNTATSAGISFAINKPTLFISGDLAFLHDIGSLMYINQYRLPVCIIVIDNNGGGIFNMLPIARNKKLLNPYFITPHNQNINKLSKAFGLRYKEITSKNLLHQYILKFFKDKKPTVLHIITDISLSTKYLEQLKKDLLNKL